MKERIQKLMAQAGLCSRRAAEQIIRAGGVTVNGRPASLGDTADPARDKILVHGKPLRRAEEKVYRRSRTSAAARPCASSSRAATRASIRSAGWTQTPRACSS